MTGPEFDAVIAGGGLSGLSLAAHLAAGGWRDRAVLVVDDPAAGPAAQRWGFWAAGAGLLDHAVSRTYHQVRVHAAGVSRVMPLDGYRYQVVRRADLHREVRARTADCPRFVWRRGRVEAVHDGPDAAEVVVDGRPVRARWVFDSTATPAGTVPTSAVPTSAVPASTVPASTAPAGVASAGAVPAGAVPAVPDPPDARLAFTGWEVRCAAPVFDPDTPTLFDFRTALPGGGARFGYVLPDSPRRALVEVTEFVPRHGRVPTPGERDAALAAYLTDRWRTGGYDVLRTESAVLPLRVRPPVRHTGRVLRIGAAGGLVKASTGYAYPRVQRDSAAIVASLVRYGHPFDIPSSRPRHRLFDALLLDVLDRDQAQLERAFAVLFSAHPAKRVLRFLDERSGPGDELRLIASLPSRPYLCAVAARIRPRRGRPVARPA